MVNAKTFLEKRLVEPTSCIMKHGLTVSNSLNSYHDDISLEDAIHTALLTLKEGFEGQMTEKTIEIGIVTVPTAAELEEEAEIGVNGRPKPSFRKLTEEEVRDYLAL
jgi:20S proteasome subunit alpha 2